VRFAAIPYKNVGVAIRALAVSGSVHGGQRRVGPRRDVRKKTGVWSRRFWMLL